MLVPLVFIVLFLLLLLLLLLFLLLLFIVEPKLVEFTNLVSVTLHC